ncbi:MAG: hypothetical protein ACOZQL_37175 [Myxococcota bacterium]
MSEQLLTELQRTGRFEAMGTSDLQVLLGMERQKAILGCSPDGESACLAEISAALGAPWVVSGSLAQFGKVTRLDLKLISAKSGKAVFRDGASFSEESALFSQVSDIVQRMVASLEPQHQPTAPAGAVVTTISGGVLTLGGAALLVVGGLGRASTTENLATLQYSEAKAQLSRANTFLLIGGLTAGVGVAALVSGVAWWRAAGPAEANVSVALSPSGVVVHGSF